MKAFQRIFVASSMLILLLTGNVAVADVAEARRLIAAGDFDTALNQLATLAEGGDADAQYELGAMLRSGIGVEKNAETAVLWFRLAADQRHAEAQYQLGSMHLTGEGLFKDDVWAINWYRKAAQQGHAQAQSDLAQIYHDNGLTPPDWSKPLSNDAQNVAVDAPPSWEEIGDNAAESEREDQKAALETARSHGIEVEYEAESSPEVAAPTESAVASASVPAPVEDAPPVEQIFEAEPEPIAKKEKKGLRGLFGKFFGKDDAEAQDAETAADAQGEPAVVDVAVEEAEPPAEQPTVDGESEPLSDEEYLEFERDTGLSSSDVGRDDLAAAEAAIVRGDYRDAVRELTPLAGRGNPKAQAMLGALYQTGQGVQQDPEMAASFYADAAEAGNADAQFNLANMYLLGEGVLLDDDLARHWYEQAALQGHQGARQNLQNLVDADGQNTAIVYAIPDEDDPEPDYAGVGAADTEIAAAAEPVFEPEPEPQSAMPAETPSREPAAMEPARGQLTRGNDEAAFREYETLAQRGDADAQFELGAMYQQGLGVEADESWAVTWYRRASEQGHAQARVRLDSIYATADINQPAGGVADQIGEDAGRDTALETPSDTSSSAEYEIAETAAETSAVTATTAAAASAAPRKSMVAKAGGGVKSLFGRLLGRHKSPAEPGAAVESLANAQAEPATVDQEVAGADGATELTTTPGEEDLVAMVEDSAESQSVFIGSEAEEEIQSSTAEDIVNIEVAKVALAQGEYSTAFRLFSILAERGNAEAQAHLGYLYNAGEGVARDPAEAVRWYRIAAAQGNADAGYNLAVAHAFGDGVAQDDSEAVKWYRFAADQNHRMAQFSLGISYAMGEGISPNDAEAVKWYRLAAEQGYASAQYNLAYMYRSGRGVTQDHHEAVRWYRRAANQSHAAAQYNLGYMYRSGKGVAQDVDEAIRWYSLAAQQGYPDAKADLATLTSN